MSRRRNDAIHYVYVCSYGKVFKVARTDLNSALRALVLDDEGFDVSEFGELLTDSIDISNLDRERAIKMLLEGY